MFKISSYALAMALLSKEAAAEVACAFGPVSSFTGECNYENFAKNLAKGCDAAELLNNEDACVADYLTGPLTKQAGDHNYKIQGKVITQGETKVGDFQSYDAETNIAKFGNGDSCNNGPRHATVEFTENCDAGGLTITSVTEPSTCYYVFKVNGACCGGAKLNAAQVKARVEHMCEAIPVVPNTKFGLIQGTYQKDRRYFAGGGTLVDGETPQVDEARMKRFEANLSSKTVINWPEYWAREKYNKNNGHGDNGYPTNMNIEKGCGMQTAMCCFAEGTFSEDGAHTTDICHHELINSPQSNHIKKNAWSIFPGREKPVHCVGFTWNEGETELLGNMMYDISLRNSINNGYLKGIPGAPMCGCIEHMPAVASSACRTATRTDATYTFDSKQKWNSQMVNLQESSRSYSSVWDNDAIGTKHARSMIDSPQGWSAQYNRAGEWMQMDLGSVQEVFGVITQPRATHDQTVKTFTVETSTDGSNFTQVIGTYSSASGPNSAKTTSNFPKPVTARYIRLVVVTWQNAVSWRAAPMVKKDKPDAYLVVSQNSGTIAYNDCADGADLKTAYKARFRKGDEANRGKIDAHLVGDCDPAIKKYLGQRFLAEGAEGSADIYNEPDPKVWSDQIAGGGIYYQPAGIDYGAADRHFRSLIEGGCKNPYTGAPRFCIVTRHCASCAASHQNIFYQRKTTLPSHVNFLDYFLTTWKSAGNNMAAGDFSLYSSYEDALLGTNAWTFCNYDTQNHGFPLDCGPSGFVGDNYTPSKRHRHGRAKHHGFYVERPTNITMVYNVPSAAPSGTATPTTDEPKNIIAESRAAGTGGVVATQSSIYEGGVASRAIDGNPRYDWGGGHIQHTQDSSNSWWKVNLGRDVHIYYVIVYNRSDCCQDRLGNTKLEILDANDKVVADQPFVGAKDSYRFDFPKIVGRSVKVNKSIYGCLNIAEVEVFGKYLSK